MHQRDCRSPRTQDRSAYYPLPGTNVHLEEARIRELKGRGEARSQEAGARKIFSLGGWSERRLLLLLGLGHHRLARGQR